jgi:hypothetical protein
MPRLPSAADSPLMRRRALNRALLARQHLLARSSMGLRDMIEHLVGLQAQDPKPPYIGLWTRLEGFDPAELSGMIERREAVRIALMRSTIHLVTARDALELRALVQPALERFVVGSYRRAIEGLDVHEIARAGRELVEREPLTFAAIGDALAQRWPDRDRSALGNAVRAYVPLVQTPPRGLWGASGPAAHTSIEKWLGESVAQTPDLDRLVLRYLAAFGPATVMDVQAWSGLTRLGAALNRLRPRLVTFRDERGRELFDLPDAPRPDPATSAPVRFLPPFDNALLSHADRTRIIDDESRRAIATLNGMIPGAVLVEGFFAAAWRTEAGRGECTIVVRPHRPVARKRAQIEREALRLLELTAPGANHAVRFEERGR